MNKPSILNKNEELHPLYGEISNKDGEVIYFHKYYGFFTEQKPLKSQSLAGGILADEMGLGKTLEVLATIVINSPNFKKLDFLQVGIFLFK